MIFVLGLLLVATLILIAFSQRGSSLLRGMGIKLRKTQADYMAEEGLERGFAKIRMLMEKEPVTEPPSEVSDFNASLASKAETYDGGSKTYEFTSEQSLGNVYRIRYRINVPGGWTDSGDGKFVYRRFNIASEAIGPFAKAVLNSPPPATAARSETILSQDLIVRRQPLYIYAIFAKGDLEVNFWGDATIKGWIHSNKNIFIDNGGGGTTAFKIIGNLTAAGHIFRNNLGAYSPPSAQTGDIRICWADDCDNTNNYALLTADNSTSGTPAQGVDSVQITNPANFSTFDLRSTTPTTWTVDQRWKDETTSKFHGLVADNTQGIEDVKSPDVRDIDPSGYYDTKASVHITTTRDTNPQNDILVAVDVDGTTIATKRFKIADTGDPTLYDVTPPPSSLYDATNQGQSGWDPAVTCVSNVCRGKGVQSGTLESGDAACGAAIGQERVWHSHEDMFVLNTYVDVQKLQSQCIKSSSKISVYATRDDAVADTTVSTTTYGDVDPNRKPYGYTLANGATLASPLFFVSDDPVTVRGDFNLHSSSGTDTWQPAAIIADRFTAQSSAYDVGYNNRFRRVMGGQEELNSSGPNTYIPSANPITVNAAIVAGETPTATFDYTAFTQAYPDNYFSKTEIDQWNTSHPTAQLPGAGTSFADVNPRSTGGFAKYLRVEESFNGNNSSGQLRTMAFDGTFLKLFASKYATNYSGRECPASTATLMGNAALQGGSQVCGAWAKGGTGGFIKTDRRNNRTYTYDPSFMGNLPTEFRNIFPAVTTQDPIPYEKTNFRRLSVTDLGGALLFP